MANPEELFQNQERLVGYVETSAGSVFLTDGVWEKDLPLTTQESLALDLDVEPCRLPVIAVRKNDKRFLIIAVDDGIKKSFVDNIAEVVDQVDIPKEKKEEPNE
jgi:hypothetical protein